MYPNRPGPARSSRQVASDADRATASSVVAAGWRDRGTQANVLPAISACKVDDRSEDLVLQDHPYSQLSEPEVAGQVGPEIGAEADSDADPQVGGVEDGIAQRHRIRARHGDARRADVRGPRE